MHGVEHTKFSKTSEYLIEIRSLGSVGIVSELGVREVEYILLTRIQNFLLHLRFRNKFLDLLRGWFLQYCVSYLQILQFVTNVYDLVAGPETLRNTRVCFYARVSWLPIGRPRNLVHLPLVCTAHASAAAAAAK